MTGREDRSLPLAPLTAEAWVRVKPSMTVALVSPELQVMMRAVRSRPLSLVAAAPPLPRRVMALPAMFRAWV